MEKISLFVKKFLAMHNIFQNDLLKLRYKTFDTYAKMLKLGNAPQNYNTTSKVKMSASLQGLGPNFKIVITVDNVGEEIIAGVDMLLDYDKNIFSFDRDYIEASTFLFFLILNFFKNNYLVGIIGAEYSYHLYHQIQK